MLDTFLTDRVTIRRAATQSVSASGSATENWSSVKANVPASIQQRATSFRQREQGLNESTRWKGYFLGREDVRVNDEIVTSRGRFKVQSVYNLGEHQEVELAPHNE